MELSCSILEMKIVNMGDRIAQLIFEKIKTPEIKEVSSLEESGRGEQGMAARV